MIQQFKFGDLISPVPGQFTFIWLEHDIPYAIFEQQTVVWLGKSAFSADFLISFFEESWR